MLLPKPVAVPPCHLCRERLGARIGKLEGQLVAASERAEHAEHELAAVHKEGQEELRRVRQEAAQALAAAAQQAAQAREQTEQQSARCVAAGVDEGWQGLCRHWAACPAAPPAWLTCGAPAALQGERRGAVRRH